MKPFAALALTLAIAGGLAACSDDEPQIVDAPSAAPTTPAPTTPSASATEDTGGADTLALVRSEVNSVAPALESFYRGKPYPRTLADAQASLEDAGITLAPGDTVGGYLYDAGATEFRLCIENESGAWATYDTGPMTGGDTGTTGGCPAKL